MKTALATKKLGLRLAVAPVGVAALITPLGSVSGVYSDDLAADSFSLILKESLELGEAPGVEPAFGFTTRGFDTAPDVGEVLNHDSRAWLNTFENRGGKDMVAIPSESLFTTSEASKVPSSRLSTFGLQLTPEAKDTLNHFLHVPISMKAVIRGDSGTRDSQVNTNGLAITGERDIGQTDNDVEEEMPLATNKVGGSRRIADCILGILRKVERYLHSTVRSRQADDYLNPIYFEGMQVIPGRTG